MANRGAQMDDKTGIPYEYLTQVIFQLIANQSDVRNIVVRHDDRHESYVVSLRWRACSERYIRGRSF
jgi:hypothetical protein